MLPNLDALPAGAAGSVLDALLLEIGTAPYIRVGDRNYPPQYFFALGRYTAAPEDVERMRAAIAGLPRVDPQSYDILFNAIAYTWDVVGWVPLPEPMGDVPGYGFMSTVVLEPMDVYSIDATKRTPATLGELDWLCMRRLCVTRRGGEDIDAEMRANNLAAWEAQEAERQEAEQDAAGYLRGVLLRMNAETGYGDLGPEEMARRTRTSIEEWLDPTSEDE